MPPPFILWCWKGYPSKKLSSNSYKRFNVLRTDKRKTCHYILVGRRILTTKIFIFQKKRKWTWAFSLVSSTPCGNSRMIGLFCSLAKLILTEQVLFVQVCQPDNSKISLLLSQRRNKDCKAKNPILSPTILSDAAALLEWAWVRQLDSLGEKSNKHFIYLCIGCLAINRPALSYAHYFF